MEILIAEDSPTQAEQLRQILEKHNFNVTAKRNGRDALEAVLVRKPTLIITDVNMPEMGGYELCRSVRSDADLANILGGTLRTILGL